MKSNFTKVGILGITSLSLILTACGGGGDGGGDGQSVVTPTDNNPPVTQPPKGEDTVPVETPIAPPPVTDPTDPVKPDTGGNPPPTPVPAPVDEINTQNETNFIKMGDKTHIGAGLAASNLISMERQNCGMGGLSNDGALVGISGQHAKYVSHVLKNSNGSAGYNIHRENSVSDLADITGKKNPFFTGDNLSDRLLAAQYSLGNSFISGENIGLRTVFASSGVGDSPEDTAIALTRSLLSAPYHLRTMVNAEMRVEGSNLITYTPNNSDPTYNKSYALISTLSSKGDSFYTQTGGILTYPCQGTTGTQTALYNESPDPTKGTGRNLRTDPIGHPVHIRLGKAKTIKVSNVKMTDVARNIDVPVNLIDKDNDPYKKTVYELPENETFILPNTDSLNSCDGKRGKYKNCGLYGNSDYRVSFDVLVDNGDLQKRSFVFKTGDSNYY